MAKSNKFQKGQNIFLSCLYDEGSKKTNYRGFEVSSGKFSKVINSKDPVKDWKTVIKTVSELLTDNPVNVLHTSSVDHFTMDNKQYSWDKDGLLVKSK